MQECRPCIGDRITGLKRGYEGLEPCSDVIAAVAACRSNLASVPKTWRDGAAFAAKKMFFEDSNKISFYPLNFLMTFISHRKLQANKYTAKMALPLQVRG